LTVVVGVKGTEGVLLAGDSQGSTFNGNRKHLNPKTVALSEILAVAGCGSARLMDILEYEVADHLEDPPLGTDERYWAVRRFIPHLKSVLYAHGALLDLKGVEYLDESAFLLAVRGRLFTVDGDFQVAEHKYPFDAVGSGEEVAIGAMRSMLEDPESIFPVENQDIEDIAIAGIKAATEFTNFVGGDITSVETVRFSQAEREIAKEILNK